MAECEIKNRVRENTTLMRKTRVRNAKKGKNAIYTRKRTTMTAWTSSGTPTTSIVHARYVWVHKGAYQLTKRCLCPEQGIPARRYGRITLRGGALHTTRNSMGSIRSESKCGMWVMCEFWQALQTMGVWVEKMSAGWILVGASNHASVGCELVEK